MNFRSVNKKKHPFKWMFLVLILILFLFTKLPGKIYDLFERPFLQAWENTNGFADGSADIFQGIYRNIRLQERIENLEEQLVLAELDIIRARYYESQLGIVDHSGIVAQVISKNITGSRDELIINKGSQHDVPLGSQIVYGDRILIGEIIEVYDYTSRIRLYSHNDYMRQGILGDIGTTIDLEGRGNAGFSFNLDRSIEVTPEDMVMDQVYQDLIVAEIVQVEFDPRDPFQTVYASLPFSIQDIQTVSIK